MRVKMHILLEILERRGIITTDPSEKETCCGAPRDKDGFCVYREYHPTYVEIEEN